MGLSVQAKCAPARAKIFSKSYACTVFSESANTDSKGKTLRPTRFRNCSTKNLWTRDQKPAQGIKWHHDPFRNPRKGVVDCTHTQQSNGSRRLIFSLNTHNRPQWRKKKKTFRRRKTNAKKIFLPFSFFESH